MTIETFDVAGTLSGSVHRFYTDDLSSSAAPSLKIQHLRATSMTSAPVLEVPADQSYYWTRAWQENERAAVADLERGAFRRFSDPMAAIRWLLSSDDED